MADMTIYDPPEDPISGGSSGPLAPGGTLVRSCTRYANKKQYFKDTIDRILLSYVNERFAFYKKMEDQRVKGFVVNSLYENYTRNLNQETIG